MLHPRWRMVLRDLWRNKTRTILVVLSIAVGVFAIGMIAGARVILARGLQESYEALLPPEALLRGEPFEDDTVDAVRAMPEVREAEGRRLLNLRFKVGAADWRDMQLMAIRDFGDIRVSKVNSVSGAWPPAKREVLIERASLDFMGVQVGDTILIESPDGKQRPLRVSGVARDITQPNAQLAGRAFGYISLDTLEWLGAPRSLDVLYVAFEGQDHDRAYNQRITNLVQDKIEKGGHAIFFTFVPEPGRHPASDFVDTLLVILGGIGLLALFLSGFLVVNTISALLTQQTRQIGVMKAIGARSSQIIQLYFGMVLIFALLSLAIAVPLGALGAYGLSIFMANFLNFDIANFYIPTGVLALEVAVGLLVPLLAALWPIIAGARITVREALSAYGLGKGRFGTGLIDRLIASVRGLPRPLLLSLRNTFRRKARLLLTLITLTLASAIFAVVFTMRASLLLTMDDALSFWNYDVYLELGRSYRAELVERAALRTPGVVAAESWAIGGVRRLRPDGSESDSIQIYGLPALTRVLQPTILQGRWLLPDDQNAMVINTDVLKNDSDIAVGSEIVIKLRGRETTWRVVGVVRGVATGAGVFVNYPYYARLTEDVGRASRVLVTTEFHDAATQARIARAVEEQFERSGIQVTTTLTLAALRELIRFFFNVMVVFLVIMAVLLGVVGGLGLMGTMSINVIERTREIGVMRAIGASNGAIFQIFIVEGLLIGLMSWAAGTLIALPISKLLSDAVGQALFQFPLSYSFSVAGALLWLAIVIVLALLACLLPSWNAVRLSVREVLSYE